MHWVQSSSEHGRSYFWPLSTLQLILFVIVLWLNNWLVDCEIMLLYREFVIAEWCQASKSWYLYRMTIWAETVNVLFLLPLPDGLERFITEHITQMYITSKGRGGYDSIHVFMLLHLLFTFIVHFLFYKRFLSRWSHFLVESFPWMSVCRFSISVQSISNLHTAHWGVIIRYMLDIGLIYLREELLWQLLGVEMVGLFLLDIGDLMMLFHFHPICFGLIIIISCLLLNFALFPSWIIWCGL